MNFKLKIKLSVKIFVFLVAVSMVCPKSVHADGMAFDRTTLRPLAQNEQMAAIFHHNGTEKMIIAINFELDDQDGAVWIFPVPGTPDQVHADVLDSFPQFRGRRIIFLAGEKITKMFLHAAYTQLYPAFFLPLIESYRARYTGLKIHDQFEKWGVRVEVFAAESVNSLIAHFPGLPERALRVFEPYLSEQYVFVAARIASRNRLLQKFPEYKSHRMTLNQRWPCLLIEFPTGRPFYPLRPTSGYGNLRIDLRLIVVEHVTIESNSYLNRLEGEYYRDYPPYQETLERFLIGFDSKRLNYTVFKEPLNAADCTHDLWFSSAGLPKKINHANQILDFRFFILLTVVLIAFVSYISAGLAGLILSREWKNTARIGLWNLLTILGLYLRVAFESDFRQAMRFSILFSFIFVFFTVILFYLFIKTLPFF